MLQLWQSGAFCKRLSSREKGRRNDQPSLDDATNKGILLMAQNEELKTKKHDGAKDDGGSREAMETVGNEVIHNGFGKITISETRISKKDEQLDNRELELEKRASIAGKGI